MGGCIGGAQTSLEQLEKSFDVLLRYCLSYQHVVNNEQILMGYLTKLYPSLFYKFRSPDGDYHILDFITNNKGYHCI